MSEPGGLVLTDEEWDEVFNNPDDAIVPRPRPWWIRWVAIVVAAGVLVGGLTGVISAIREINKIGEPADVFERTRMGVAESEWGWLVQEIQIVTIDEPRVGAFVINNPANGVIHIDDRRWGLGALDELMDHEIGHLLDFAIYKDFHPRDPARRGGLEQEVWAECAAVDAGERSTDPERNNEEYRCRDSEYAIFQAEIAGLEEICRPWGVPKCRNVAPRPVTD